MKQEYIEKILKAMNETEDIALLDFILKLLVKNLLKNRSVVRG